MGSCVNVEGRGTAPRLAGTVVALAIVATAGVVGAQPSCAPDEQVPLYSPESLAVDFETRTVLGNRLTWPAVQPEEANCTLLDIEPDLQSRLQASVAGDYRDVFDRRIVFTFQDDGRVGTTELDALRVTAVNAHANPSATNVSVALNLSSRGGIFRWSPGARRATQANEGIPTYMPSTEIRAFGRSRDGSVVYVGVDRVGILRSDDGGRNWSTPIDGRPPFGSRVLSIVVSSNDPDRVWILTASEGLLRSDDGGTTWQQETAVDPDPGVTYNLFEQVRCIPPGGSEVQDVIFAHVTGQGLSYSADDGASFQPALGMLIPSVRTVNESNVVDCTTLINGDESAVVNDIAVSRVDPGRIYLALKDWGVVETDVQGGFQEWEPRLSGLVLCFNEDPFRPLGRRRSVDEIVVLPNPDPDPDAGDALVAISDIPPATGQDEDDEPDPVVIAFSSFDGGRTWQENAGNWPGPIDSPERANELFLHPDRTNEAQTVVAAVRGQGLWQLRVSSTAATDWQQVTYDPEAPLLNPRVSNVLTMPDGSVLLATTGAGSYRVGAPIDLDRAIELATPAGEVPVQVGLEVTFDGTGEIEAGEVFRVFGQSYQGYAVWRSRRNDPATGEPIWEMIGLYDLTNPEACSEDPCDVTAIEYEPGCFADKRANCFVLPADPVTGQWEFFDRDVSAGFSYNYAVSTFDYGFTGDVTPEGSRREMFFSPRSALESSEQAPPAFRELRDGENYNRVFFQVNIEPANDLSDVYAVPNPFIRTAGWDVGDGRFIRFFNVTESASVEIYTIAGDFVRKIDNVIFDGRETGIIEWDTKNEEGEDVASGVYIYRVTDADGGEEVSRLTLIR